MQLITSPLTRMLLGAALIAVSLSLGSSSDGCERAGGDIRRIVPADAPGVFVIESLEKTRAAAASFLAGVEGASGLLELVKERYGVELRGPEGFAEVGLDGAGGLALFAVDKGIAAVMSVRDAALWEGLMASRAKLLGAKIAKREPKDTVTLARSGNKPTDLRLAWGVTGDGIGLAVVTTAEGDPSTVFKAVAGGKGGFFETAAAKEAATLANGGDHRMWAVGSWTPPYPKGRLPTLIEAQLEPAVSGLNSWKAALTVSGKRLALRAQGRVTTKGDALPVGWFTTQSPRVAFESVLPRMATFVTRARTGLRELIATIPTFVLERFLPDRTPSIDRFPMPSPASLVELLDGNVAVAFLGLDDDALLTHLGNPRLPREMLAQYLHVAVGIGVTDVAAARAMLDQTAAAARKAKFAVARVGADIDGMTAYSFVTRRRLWRLAPHQRKNPPPVPPRTYALVLSEKHRVLFFITGRGEISRFMDVAAGRGLALAAVEGNATVDAAIAGTTTGASAVALPTRIARELADKGVPPFFLKMLSDLHVVGITLNIGETEVELAVDVQL